MKREAQRMFPKETGGVLMGYQAASEMVVTSVIGPGPNAVHGGYAFVPDYNYQEEEIARVYEESGRNAVYLGDWHTHPDGLDRLSEADRRTLKIISDHKQARINRPVMVILWGRGEWSFAAWRGWRSRPFLGYRRFQIGRVEIVQCD
jgi:integrative and conjugative element protein (TIGR02256 family)